MKNKLIGIIICILLVGTVIPASGTLIIDKTTLSNISGNILYVGGSGDGNYTKIQDAIDNASDGDIVFVYDDSSPYLENIEVNRSINLIGEDRDTTVIDGNHIGDVIGITADWVNISGFTIQHSEHGTGYDAGINLASNYCTITDNIFIDNDWCMDIRSSGYNTISDNICSSICGIHLAMSFNNIITDNIISNEYSGIQFQSSDGNTVSNNIFFNVGIEVYGSYQNTVSENIVNGKPILYFEDKTDIIIDEVGYAGQIIIVRCNDITVQNQVLSGINVGLRICDSSKCYVSGNIISDNYHGVAISDSTHVIFINNTIYQNGLGIGVYRDRGGTIISGNKIFEGGSGMYIFNCRQGVDILDNNVSGNSLGMDISSGTNNCNVTGNELSNNTKGIKVTLKSHGNLIFHNNFINNQLNAHDECCNSWDDGKYGNYWNDYKEKYPDAKKRQLRPWMWNTPYEIPGGDNKDRCPLIKQWPYSKSRTIFRDTASYSSYLLRFLEQFPILQTLLQQLGLQ